MGGGQVPSQVADKWCPSKKLQRLRSEWFSVCFKCSEQRRTTTANDGAEYKRANRELNVQNRTDPNSLAATTHRVRSSHSRINYLGSFKRRRMMFNRSGAMISDGRDGYAFLVKWSVTFGDAVGRRRLKIAWAAIAVVQAVDVLRDGTLFAARDGRRLADGARRDTTDARLASRALTFGRVVADVRRDVMASQHRVHIAVHLHALR